MVYKWTNRRTNVGLPHACKYQQHVNISCVSDGQQWGKTSNCTDYRNTGGGDDWSGHHMMYMHMYDVWIKRLVHQKSIIMCGPDKLDILYSWGTSPKLYTYVFFFSHTPPSQSHKESCLVSFELMVSTSKKVTQLSSQHGQGSGAGNKTNVSWVWLTLLILYRWLFKPIFSLTSHTPNLVTLCIGSCSSAKICNVYSDLNFWHYVIILWSCSHTPLCVQLEVRMYYALLIPARITQRTHTISL